MLKRLKFSILCAGLATVFATPALAFDTPLKPTRFISTGGSRVAVYESTGRQGPGILLVHGNTSSANSFAKIMGSPAAKQYRIVAVDLPGFGRSEKRASYNIESFRQTIYAVAKATRVDKGIFVGWSLGGDLVLQASVLLKDAKGFFLFGTAPLGGAPTTSPPPFLGPQESYAGEAVLYGTTPVLTRPQVQSYVKGFFKPGYTQIPSMMYQDGYKTDPNTRLAVAMAVTGNDPGFLPEVQLAQNLKVPLALIYSGKDAFVRLEYLKSIESSLPTLWRKKIQVVPNQGHALQWENPDRLMSIFEAFLKDL